jgi:hypothetical protein
MPGVQTMSENSFLSKVDLVDLVDLGDLWESV